MALPPAVTHDLLRLMLEYLSDPSLYNTPAPELLSDFHKVWDHIKDLQYDTRFFSCGHHDGMHIFNMIVNLLQLLCNQLYIWLSLPVAESCAYLSDVSYLLSTRAHIP
jgi:hypothetical protein